MANDRGTVDVRHEALAVEIGTAREVISRQLAAFARAGLIDGTRGEIGLISLDGLKALAVED
jgi:CRP/FNR family transcriptional regulator